MNVHKHARMTKHGRLLLVQRVRHEGWPVRHAAEAAGVSERTAYKWLARFRGGGAAALDDRSSAPRRCPHRLSTERVAAVERLRRQRWTSPRIARRTGVDAGASDPVPVPMTRSDVADYVDLTVETVSRTLGRLKKAGLIRIPEAHEVVLVGRDAIEGMAEGL